MKHLIKIVKGEPVVSTEVIAIEFGRRHDNVMQNIRSLIETEHLGALDFKETSYIDKSNRSKPCFELTERGFLIAMPFIGGDKARDGQVRLVDSFIEYREKAKRESAIQAERDLARVEYRPMTNAIKLSKEAEGKEAEHYHFSNEANLINRIVLGATAAKFRKDNDIGKTEAIRDYLSAEQIRAITPCAVKPRPLGRGGCQNVLIPFLSTWVGILSAEKQSWLVCSNATIASH